MSSVIVGLLTCAYGDGRISTILFAFPENPVTGFRHEKISAAYSGGTVRESHPVILFSQNAVKQFWPRNGAIFYLQFHDTTEYSGCKLHFSYTAMSFWVHMNLQ